MPEVHCLSPAAQATHVVRSSKCTSTLSLSHNRLLQEVHQHHMVILPFHHLFERTSLSLTREHTRYLGRHHNSSIFLYIYIARFVQVSNKERDTAFALFFFLKTIPLERSLEQEEEPNHVRNMYFLYLLIVVVAVQKLRSLRYQ